VEKQLNEQITEYASNKPFAIQIHMMTEIDMDANKLIQVRFTEKGNINQGLFLYKSLHKKERLRTFRYYQ
jgi:hypothetical protein